MWQINPVGKEGDGILEIFAPKINWQHLTSSFENMANFPRLALKFPILKYQCKENRSPLERRILTLNWKCLVDLIYCNIFVRYMACWLTTCKWMKCNQIRFLWFEAPCCLKETLVLQKKLLRICASISTFSSRELLKKYKCVSSIDFLT